MYRKRMAVLSLSLFAPILLGLLLFDAVNARRTGNGEPSAPVVDTLADEYDLSCADGDCSLRDALTVAAAGETVTFNVTGTIVLSPALGYLSIYQDLTIDGGGVITVSGNHAVSVFRVTTSYVTFDSLTIANGREEYSSGGGIYNQGTVTVTNSTLSGNSALNNGGGIFNLGTVTVTNSTLSGNSALNGGGIFNLNGSVEVTNSTLSGNSAIDNGGGIYISAGTVAVSNSTFSGNTAADYGGGIYNLGTVTVSNSTLSGNSSDRGGGIFSNNMTMINNSTLSGNSADSGAGIYNNDNTVTVNNSTVSNNRAVTIGGGIASVGDNQTFTTITNTIVSGNVISGTTTADDLMLFTGPANSYTSGGYNLIGAISAEITSITATGDITGKPPLIGPLADNGGNTFTHALLPSSLAIDNGECSSGPAADQRGVARPQDGSCDTGAYERICTMIVMNDQSSGADSLRETIATVCDGGLITFDSGLANSMIDISPDGELLIDKSVTIKGNVPITVSGGNAVRVFNVTAGNVTFDGLTIANGNIQTIDCGVNTYKCGGGGIILQNSGVVVTVTNSTLFGNSANYGGGIYNSGTVTVTNSTLSGNSADQGGGIRSGSVYSDAPVMINNSTLSGNSAELGGGIFNWGILTVTNSTLSGNSAEYGGGIINFDNTVTVNNSTISDNRAGTNGGGITSWGDHATFTTIANTIVSGNVISGTTTTPNDLALKDGNTNSYTSGGYNLIGAIGDNITSITATGDITNTLPLVGPLADNGGDTFTHALLPGSLAIDNGRCSGGPAVDQRGVARSPEGSCDSGAFESRGFSLTVTGGSPQTTFINTPFANPLALTISNAFNEPVKGGQVTFSAPASGASVTLPEEVVTIGGGGVVTLPVTANGTDGSYEVGANASGNSGDGLIYNLTNLLSSYMLTVDMGGSGSGTVTSSPAGIDCGSDCSKNYNTFTVVTMTPKASTGSTFSGWSGACTGMVPCEVTMNGAKTVTATFTLITNVLTVLKDGDGEGLVSSVPAGISCGADCAASYDFGTVVTLTAAAGTGSTFSGWTGGGCSGTATCEVTMDAAKTITASFIVIEYTVFLPVVVK